jgi:hypothetical protein
MSWLRLNTILVAGATAGALCIITPSRGSAEPKVIKYTPLGPQVTAKATPFEVPMVVGIKKGLLTCQGPNLDDCWVNGLPPINQSDQRIFNEFKQFLATIPKSEMPPKKDQKGNVEKGSDGKPLKLTPEEVISDFFANGCYDASIAAVTIAALANRNAVFPALINRTKEFDAVAGTPAVPTHVRKLIWIYEHAFQDHNKIQVNGKAVQSYHMMETVADLGHGKIKEACNPYIFQNCNTASVDGPGNKLLAQSQINASPSPTTVSNAKLIDDLKNGRLSIIAFERFAPKKHFDEATGTLTISFEYEGHHKVVLGGFDFGEYPLRILDVGDGNLHRETVSSDLDILKFSMPGKTVKAVKFDHNANIGGNAFNLQSRPFKVDHLIGKIDPIQVQFISEVDTVYVEPK